jgi:hypothetical protein
MLKIFYSFLLTTLLTNCKAQTADDFQQNINEMKRYKAILGDDDDFDNIENKLIVDISGGVNQVKINEKMVDSVEFTSIISTFLNTNKNKKSLLVAGSRDHATIGNIVVFTRLFNQCKTLFDVKGDSKIFFKSFKDVGTFKVKTANIDKE